MYGFKTSVQQILLADIGDIVKTKKQGKQFEQFLNDKDYYDDNIKADTLILRNLVEEARVSVEFIQQGTKMIKKKQERKSTGETKPISKDKQKQAIHELKRISYNLRSEQDSFVNEFV